MFLFAISEAICDFLSENTYSIALKWSLKDLFLQQHEELNNIEVKDLEQLLNYC